MKYSMQREIILDYVKKNPVHPTAGHVYNALREQHPSLSLGTVYRNLNTLSEIGMIKRIELADTPDRFDGNIEPHFHAICSECGEVYDFDVKLDVNTFLESIDGHGFKEILSYQIIASCICYNCKENNK